MPIELLDPEKITGMVVLHADRYTFCQEIIKERPLKGS
jgi:hypothetical protein